MTVMKTRRSILKKIIIAGCGFGAGGGGGVIFPAAAATSVMDSLLFVRPPSHTLTTSSSSDHTVDNHSNNNIDNDNHNNINSDCNNDSDTNINTNTNTSTDNDTTIRVPLEFIPTLNAYVVHYYLFGERFGAIVDTGSPFLTVPATCSTWSYKYLWGCYKPELTLDSGYTNTYEGFDNNQGIVVWRKARFTFFDENNNNNNNYNNNHHQHPQQQQQDLVFGVFGPDLLDGPGGVFLGLIKDTDKWIRPSFLGQTGYSTFCVDLRQRQKQQQQQQSDNATSTTLTSSSSSSCDEYHHNSSPQLVLSKSSLIQDTNVNSNNNNDNDDNGSDNVVGDYIPLVRDLNRRYKAPVVHYTARASKFVVNGLPLQINDKKRPTYVIFDTGLSGMSVSEELYDGRYLQARKNKEKSLWGTVIVSFETKFGKEVHLTATKPLTTPLGQATPWTKFKGNLIVIGLAFLDGMAMTIDADDGKLQFSR